MAWYDNLLGNNKKKAKKRAFKRSYQGANTGRLFADFLTTQQVPMQKSKTTLES